MADDTTSQGPAAPAQASPGAADATGDGTVPTAPEPGVEAAQAALMAAALQHPFGPGFFMTQLRGYAGDHAPDAATGLPVVEIHLADGDVLDLCHIIGVTPQWVALAVRESDHASGTPRVRTEFVPYENIARVTVRASRPESPHLGFEHSRVPVVIAGPAPPEMSPEAAIKAAAIGREGR